MSKLKVLRLVKLFNNVTNGKLGNSEKGLLVEVIRKGKQQQA